MGRVECELSKSQPSSLDESLDQESVRTETQLDCERHMLRIRDPRVFRRSRRTFCRHLVQKLTARSEVKRTTIDLDSSLLQIEFLHEFSSPRRIAAVFSDSINESLSLGEREPVGHFWRRPLSDWDCLTGFGNGHEGSIWETRRDGTSTVRIRRCKDHSPYVSFGQFAREMAKHEGIHLANASLWSRELTILFHEPIQTSDQLLDIAELVWRSLAARSIVNSPNALAIPRTHHQQAFYLALAMGSVLFLPVALVVPGVPTAPVLLATSYFLARASTRLHERLLRARLIGPILRESEEFHGLSRHSKRKLIAATLIGGGITILITSPGFSVLMVLILSEIVSIFGITRMHEIDPKLVESQPRSITTSLIPA